MNEDQQRRDGEREAIELRVEYRRMNMFFADYTKNISKGGTFIRTKKPLPIGTQFVFSLVVPSFSEPLCLTGKVIWSVLPEDASTANPAGMGIEFQYDNDQQRERVDGIVRGAMTRELGQALTNKLLGKQKK